MSNKKRIKAKINSLQEKEQIKRLRLAVQIASYIIQKAIDYNRALRMPFPAGAILAHINEIETEKVIDSIGNEKVIPKYDIKTYKSDCENHVKDSFSYLSESLHLPLLPDKHLLIN